MACNRLNINHCACDLRPFQWLHGFFGLEFELKIPTRVPNANTTIFGVFAETMQCSYDSKGNMASHNYIGRKASRNKGDGLFQISLNHGQFFPNPPNNAIYFG